VDLSLARCVVPPVLPQLGEECEEVDAFGTILCADVHAVFVWALRRHGQT
jgi:hypothetical protein